MRWRCMRYHVAYESSLLLSPPRMMPDMCASPSCRTFLFELSDHLFHLLGLISQPWCFCFGTCPEWRSPLPGKEEVNLTSLTCRKLSPTTVLPTGDSEPIVYLRAFYSKAVGHASHDQLIRHELIQIRRRNRPRNKRRPEITISLRPWQASSIIFVTSLQKLMHQVP